MSTPSMRPFGAGLTLQFPQSLGVYDTYEQAQRVVDHLSDNGFPVENCMIVGTDLKQVERVTGRLTTGRVAMGGVATGLWLGLLIGLLFSIFGSDSAAALSTILACLVIGALFGVIWALVGYAATRGRRDFTSVSQVVATHYEVLVEHKHAERGRELVAKLPGVGGSPFGG